MSKIVVQISYSRSVSSAQWTKRKIQIGSVDDVSITTSSTITSHPIVSGDMISDHMFREPITIKVSGTISTHGDSYSTNFGNLTLAQMQTEFEKIKNNGILCELTKIDTSVGEDTPKFIKRSNMALTSITWTEGIDDMKFDFSFNEVMTARITVDNVDSTDPYLPTTSDLISSNFTEDVFRIENLRYITTLALYDTGHIWDRFLEEMIMTSSQYIIENPQLGSYSSNTFDAAYLTGFDKVVYESIVDAINEVTSASFRTTFRRFVESDSGRTAAITEEAAIYLNLLDQFCESVLLLNDVITLYRFSNGGEQIAYGDINGEYYKFKFEKVLVPARSGVSPTTGKQITYQPDHWSYSLKVYTISDTLIKSYSQIDTAPQSFIDLANHVLFKTNSRYVYLLYGKANQSATINESIRAEDTSSTKYDADVTRCRIISSSIDLKQFKQTLTKNFKNLLLR